MPISANFTVRQALTSIIASSMVLMAFAEAGQNPIDGLREDTISHQGRERSYFYHLPARPRSDGPFAVLFALHGGGKAEGDDYAERTGYNAIADREGFIVVYPNGVEAQWNDGRGVTFRGIEDNSQIDDVGYIRELIDLFIREHNADPSRIYVEGSSNGGMMTQRIGCELSDKIAAIASVISSMPENIARSCAPEAYLPVLMMNATTDPWVPYEGGTVVPFGRPSGEIISTADNISFWVKHNECQPEPVTRSLPNTNRRDKSSIRKYTYRGCIAGGEVVLYEVIGGGHNRPGMIGRVPGRLMGPKNKDIRSSEEIWRFLSRFSR